jgi:hypothetical protein
MRIIPAIKRSTVKSSAIKVRALFISRLLLLLLGFASPFVAGAHPPGFDSLPILTAYGALPRLIPVLRGAELIRLNH